MSGVARPLLKSALVRLGLWGLLPPAFITWAIVRLGLRHA